MKIDNYLFLKELIGSSEGLSDCEVLTLTTSFKITYLKRGQTIAKDSMQGIYLIKKGVVKISDDLPTGTEPSSYLLGKGHVFGESKIFKLDQLKYKVKALTDLHILCIDAYLMMELCKKYPMLTLSIAKISMQKQTIFQNQLVNIHSKTAEERILNFITQFVHENGEFINSQWSARNLLNQTDIAEITNTSRQTVNNTISKYRRSGDLRYDRDQIVISNNSLLFPAA